MVNIGKRVDFQDLENFIDVEVANTFKNVLMNLSLGIGWLINEPARS